MSSDERLHFMKILVVDDNKDFRGMIKNMLLEMGITQVYEASNGREALGFVDVAPDLVDIIICDWNMPEMNGLSFLKQIRTVYPELPFLMVTGRSDFESVSTAKYSGVSAYIRKPFSPNQLEAKLRIIVTRMPYVQVANY